MVTNLKEKINTPSPHKDRVLIADDSPDALRMMKKALENHGFEVETVTTGQDCYDLFLNSEFHLLVLDFMMPGLNGIETLRKVRKHRNAEEFPVIMITAKQSKELLQVALKSGVNDFVLKPVRASEFIKIVENILVEVSDEMIQKMLYSLNVSDPSTFDSKIRQNLLEQDLVCYPFKMGENKCCAILKLGTNPHSVAKHTPSQIANELVLMAKGGFLWNTIWPRHSKARFAVTKEIFDNTEDLSDILKID